MANCEITDQIGYWSSAGTFVGAVGALVYAVPDLSSRRYPDGGGTFRTQGINPNIQGNVAFQLGRVAATITDGVFTFALPYGSAGTHPGTPTPRWTIVLPDGKMLTGVVPDLAGPFTLDDLATATGTGVAAWQWANEVYVAPRTPGTLARGSAPFSGASSYAVIFTSPFAALPYLKLTASTDSISGQIPEVAYSSKSTSGFTINVSDTFTGSVDWEAIL